VFGEIEPRFLRDSRYFHPKKLPKAMMMTTIVHNLKDKDLFTTQKNQFIIRIAELK
jgi:hypothetical protein